MTGANRNHGILNHLDGTRCNTFVSDIKVKIETKNGNCFFYPDVLVVCDDDNSNEYYTEKPIIIVEVLSKSTRKFDQTLKFETYKSLPSLQEYVLIEQEN